MKKTLAKHYYELCEHAHKETEQRKEFEYPDWLKALRNEKKAAQNSYVGLEAAILMVSHSGGELAPMYPGLQKSEEITLSELFATWGVLTAMNGQEEPYKPLKSAFLSLSEYAKFLQSNFRAHSTSELCTSKSMHEVVTEACEREAARVTPEDIAELMLIKSQARGSIDVYAQDGLGIFYSLRQRVEANLVGDEYGSSLEKIFPKSLRSINQDCQTWYQNSEFTNKQFLDFEWTCGAPGNKSDVLLVNASKIDVPFVDADERSQRETGQLNSCLDAGYETVVVLVSNHYLTAGRGMAEQILKFCLRKGLRSVVQLPMGILGFKSHQHSILVFKKGVNSDKVTFDDLSDEVNTRTAKRGFGLPRRAKELKQNGDGMWGLEYISRKTDIGVSQLIDGSPKAKRLLSFEAGQFISRTIDPFESLRDTYTFVRISELMDVFRAHHIEENGETSRISYQEVGASSINEFGWLDVGRERECGIQALDKRKTQVLIDKDIVLCFRGAPDSLGKVGLYRKNPSQISIPNQSFVILRMKNSASQRLPPPELVIAWLRSSFAQNYLRSKSISPDVVRVAPKDIAAMEIPIGPENLIDDLHRKLETIEVRLLEINKLKQEISLVEKDMWCFEASANRN